MLNYVSTKGLSAPKDFCTAILEGYASDGGLFVPEKLPLISEYTLNSWKDLSYQDLAFEVLSLFIDTTLIPEADLRTIIHESYKHFSSSIVEFSKLQYPENVTVLELFHGPTLSFKDMAMFLLINMQDYLLEKRGQSHSLLIATTGDTGPAAALASAGKKNIKCWVLYPADGVTREQALQMSTVNAENVFPIAVTNCPNGGDSLDQVISDLFEDKNFKDSVKISSVNSVNWCRVMVQAVHYFYSYFKLVDTVGEKIIFSVPTGAFGNLFGGYLAKTMGLPIEKFICANNKNDALHKVLAGGTFERLPVQATFSNAIDIGLAYNFWRLCYYALREDSNRLRTYMDVFQKDASISFDAQTQKIFAESFWSASVSDIETKNSVQKVFNRNNGYLIDPHTAVAIAAIEKLSTKIPDTMKVVCVATAHPAKFPEVIKNILEVELIPQSATHPAITKLDNLPEKLAYCEYTTLKDMLYQHIKANNI